MKPHKIIMLFCCMSFLTMGYSDTINIEFDQTCMNRYEYHFNGNAKNSHIAYSIKLNDWETVILEIGTESTTTQSSKPANVISCRKMSFSERSVRQINSGEMQINVVKRSTYGYTTSSVQIASYLYSSPYEMGYTTKDFSFAYSYSADVDEDTNLAAADSEGDIFYRGFEANSCPKKYYFRKISFIYDKPYTDFIIAPGVGITSVKISADPEGKNSNRSELATVNGSPVYNFLNNVCNGKTNAVTSTSTGTNTTTSTRPSTSTNGTTVTTGTTSTSYYTGEIYKDADKGLYYNRSTGKLAEGSYGGATYRNGILVSGTGYIGSTTTTTGNTYTSSTSLHHSIYKDLDKGYYIDRSTGRAANGTFGAVRYVNGYPQGSTTTITNSSSFVGPVYNDAYVTTFRTHDLSQCGIYKDLDRGLYIDRNTNAAANRSCGGNTFVNGRMINKTIGTPNTTVIDTNPIILADKGHTKPKTQTIVVDTRSSNRVICNEVSTSETHIVQSDETLYGISKRYGVSLSQLRSWNGLQRTDLIMPCKRLRIAPPYRAPVAKPQTVKNTVVDDHYEVLTSKGGFHTVKRGETLYGIARMYGFTSAKLRNMNELSRNHLLREGEVLKVNDCNCDADGNPLVATAYDDTKVERLTPKGNNTNTEVRYETRTLYRVKNEDTLYSISKKYGITVDRLRRLNDLSNTNLIQPGQELYVN